MHSIETDEIEFFGFIPSCFIKELKENIIQTLNENNADEETLKLFEKNFYIFENFVLRNVFRFPVSFKFERKITDLRIEENVQKKINEYLMLVKEETNIIREKQIFQNKLDIQKYKYNEYLQINKIEKEMDNLLDSSIKMVNYVQSVSEMRDTFLKSNCGKNNTDLYKMMEHKEIRNNVYKNELKELLEKANIEDFQRFIKNL
ncbi:hypothetical protein CWI38_0709p0050 [Hamiltosporidium tvaerminnensis]|uniref:Uncharacterized protein n=1 Tax=Hamiltosporidium tvaerminnensis TaxID=1176355 RepID=A0A4Q9LV64_9MICR|nr:hypothetical protein CWI38_1523p0050 [Hamiltosporidium tvaerminnensis]TBU12568.1 hypothetical protein CWI38_0709p0050 [Hamiltosporidium tvaerminnensis]